MARAATRARAQTGLYGLLAAREELAARNGWRMVQASGQVYRGDPARLADFRGGRPVALPAWDMPESARGGERRDCLIWRTAVVWPDGEVMIRVATGAEVLADLGL
jgi:hypothetical protein